MKIRSMNFNIKALIKAIRDRRMQLNYTQEYVAACIGVSQNAYSKLELGNSNLTVDRFVRVCHALETNVCDMLKPTLQAA